MGAGRCCQAQGKLDAFEIVFDVQHSLTRCNWQAAEEAGKDYDRIKAMSMTVDHAERWVAKRTHKHVDESIDTSTHAFGKIVPCNTWLNSALHVI
jgi:hypothetical protein